MFLIVRPVKGLPEPPPQATSRGEQLQMRLQFRRAELDRFWQRIAQELQLDGDRLQRAERRVEKMPGLGMLIVDEDAVPYESLRKMDWLRVWRERRVPTPSFTIPEPPAPESEPEPEPESAAPQPPAPPPPPPPSVWWPFWQLNMIKKPAGLTGSQVTIGVIDFGYTPSYPDLGAFAPSYAAYVDPTSTTMGGMIAAAPSEPPGINHGSIVCTLLAGGTCGVAPGATYRVASIVSSSYSGTQVKMASALEWLLTHPNGAHIDRPFGCDIVTTSVFTNYYGIYDVPGDVEAMFVEVEGWNTLAIAAVGNGGANNWQAPGCYETVLAVGSVEKNRKLAYFSAYGSPDPKFDKPDLVAPGRALEWPDGVGGVLTGEGTSFSAPIVAGAAALILERQPVHRTSVVKFRSAVTSFTKPAKNPGIGTGRGICNLTGL